MATQVLRSSNAFGKTAQNSLLIDIQKPSSDISQLEKRIKTEVFQKRIRIKEIFYDYDRLRKGIVTQDKFKTALSMLNIFLNEADINALIQKYHFKEDLINYASFCASIDEVFEDLEKTRGQLLKQDDKEQEPELPMIINNLRQIIKTKRIMIKSPFQDFDRTKSSKVSNNHFARVLRQLGLLPSDKILHILQNHYGANGEVNYIKFCDDVDNVQEMIKLTSLPTTTIPQQSIVLVNNSEDIFDANQVNLANSFFTSKRVTGPHTLDQILKKLQAEVVMKQIRIKEFFKDFDKLRKGTVSATQFRRILNMENIILSEKEYQIILQKYQESSGLVNYYEFTEDIDKIFTQKGIEKDPLYKVQQIDNNTTDAARRLYLQFTEEEQGQLENIISLYRQEIQNKRVHCKTHFQDFDKVNQGYISKNQFQRILHQFGLYPDESALNLLLRKYIDKGNLNEVNYYSFCRDVDIFDDGVDISQKHADQFKTYVRPDKFNLMFQTILKDKPNDLQDLLAKLRKKIQEKRIRIREFLKDFDKLRSGTLTIKQLRQGLNMAQLPLSNEEFESLVQEFSCSDKKGYINWRQFCDQVDEMAVIKNLEIKDQSEELPQPNTQFNYGRTSLTEKQIQIAELVKRRFTNFCKATRLDIKQFFQDWDRLGRNKISQKQFRQVLATMNFPLTDQDYDAILKMYAAEDENEVRYVDFVNDTLPPPFEVQNIVKVNNHDFINSEFGTEKKQFSENNNSYTDPDILLNKIKKEVLLKQLRIGEFQKDHDPMRKGTVPKNKFRGILSQMKIDLDENELRTIEMVYLNEFDDTKVDFQKFLSDINSVFTKPNLEKDPLAKPEKFNAPLFLDPKDALTSLEEQQFHEFMLRLGEVIRKHRILLKPHFMDKDKAKSGKVSFNRFRAILDFHKLPLSDQQYTLLCKRFAFQKTEFNYVEFIELLKQYEGEI